MRKQSITGRLSPPTRPGYEAIEAHTSIIFPFWSYQCHSNSKILSPILLTLSDDISLPYSGKFSLVQIFAENRQDSSEEILTVFIFAERGTLWSHIYQLTWHLRSVSYGFVGILYSRRPILLYSNHLEGRQTVENHLVHMGARLTHVMMSSISILVHFFAVFIFAEAGLSLKIAKNLDPAKISHYTVW